MATPPVAPAPPSPDLGVPETARAKKASASRDTNGYTVMRLVTGMPDKVGIAESWDVIATVVEAAGAREAVRKAAEKTEGVYLAVPERSWNPVKVTVETQTVVKLGEA